MRDAKAIFFFAALLIVHPVLMAQSKEEKIKAIRLEFQKINRDSSLQLFTLDDAEEIFGVALDNGAELTGYFRKDSIRKMLLTVGLSYGEISQEYYFKNGRLIFVYESEKKFPVNDSLGTNHEKLIPIFEGRYYFDNDKLISKAEKGSRTIPDNKDVTPRLLSMAKKHTATLTARRKDARNLPKSQ